ncbi:MAG TPA: nitrite/sulfite reductase [Alphaproteobacteria bacterium]|jgi:sulfite reductase (NADPH) hemoprotein beta-component
MVAPPDGSSLAQAGRARWTPEMEPLARLGDGARLREALAKYRSGEWDEEQWTSFRLRQGIYGQRQPGVQMVRIKVPGGILPFAWARTVAQVNRDFAQGDIHVTTRQDFQIYYVKTDDTPDVVEALARGTVTTREGCGNTLRNFTACTFAGICPRERVDAGKVAAQLAQSWLRHPLVQNMPRKFKVSVSGCATDCGASGIHDLGLIAVEKNGRKGFRVFAGGGTGGQPVAAVEVVEFVTEDALPAVLEALARLHQRYSNRVNRNAARIKFVLKRFGAATFRKLFEEEFERVRALPQRPWAKLAWREPTEAPEPVTPHGIVRQHDGKVAVVVSPVLGLLSADQLAQLADIAEDYGADHLRTSRDQTIAVIGVDPADVDDLVAEVRGIGLPVQERLGDTPDLVSCPGTTSCRIGITNSQGFGQEIADLLRGYAPLPNVKVRISGCQNGCGLHHVGDFGFRGMGKKIDGRNAPHYQIYLGGNDRENGAIGYKGPIVPARHAKAALKLLLDGFAAGRREGETVRGWAERLGETGVAEILAPLASQPEAAGEDVYVDWGMAESFTPPTVHRAECASGYAIDTLYQNLADDGLINVDRALYAGLRDRVLDYGREATVYAARRVLARLGRDLAADATAEAVLTATDEALVGDALATAFDAVRAAEAAARRHNGDADLDGYRETLALWLDSVEEAVKKPLDSGAFDSSLLGDSDGSVAALIGAAE